MRYDKAGRRPSGGLGDLTVKRAAAVKTHCAMCGAGLLSTRKTFCGPCYGERIMRAQRKAAPPQKPVVAAPPPSRPSGWVKGSDRRERLRQFIASEAAKLKTP